MNKTKWSLAHCAALFSSVLVFIPQIGVSAAQENNVRQTQEPALLSAETSLQLQNEVEPILAPELKTKIEQLNKTNLPLLSYVPNTTASVKKKPLFEGNFFSDGKINPPKIKVYRLNRATSHYVLNFEGDGLINYTSSLLFQAALNEENSTKPIRAVGYAELTDHAKNHVLGHVINLPHTDAANFVTINADGITLSIKENIPKNSIQIFKHR